MAETKELIDKNGVIYDAIKYLPDEKHRKQFLEGLAELENNTCHITRQYPVTKLHVLKGYRLRGHPIYRVYVDKISGWRMHVQFVEGQIQLNDLIEAARHDDAIAVIESKKHRYAER